MNKWILFSKCFNLQKNKFYYIFKRKINLTERKYLNKKYNRLYEYEDNLSIENDYKNKEINKLKLKNKNIENKDINEIINKNVENNINKNIENNINKNDIYFLNNKSDYIKLLEKKAYEINNSKYNFNKIKNINDEKKYQQLDYTTLYLLANELNILLTDAYVEHITQVDDKTIVFHLNKNNKQYYLYLCYDNNNPVISLGIKIKKLFNRFVDNDYAQKLNPILKYSIISNIYMKQNFIKILCIDFIIMKNNNLQDVENIDNILNNSNKVTLLFDMHYNSCVSFVINKVNNEIVISPFNYVTEKLIDKSYKEGQIYYFPKKEECKQIPSHYEFFSSFINLFKSRKEQNFISSLLDIYEGISINLLKSFFNYYNIPFDAKIENIDKAVLFDFFNNFYIKWIRFLILKEYDNFVFYPHFDYKLNLYSCFKFLKKETNKIKNDIDVKYELIKENNAKEYNVKDNINNDNIKNTLKKNCKDDINENDMKTKIKFDTIIELVYYYYAETLSVNKFYNSLRFCKNYIEKKLPKYEEMLSQYKKENKEKGEKLYILYETVDNLYVFNHTVSKMKDWIDKKTYDALLLIEKELKYNKLEDKRKTYIKKKEEKKEKQEILENKIINKQPNIIKTPQNIYKGMLLIRINENDLSSPYLIIGKNSKQNEKISTQILKYNDLWFHVHEFASSHVILRNKKINGHFINSDTNLDDIKIDDDIKYASNMVSYFSKVRKQEKTLVCFTLGKYVLKDNTMNEGSVRVLKYKLLYGRPHKVAQIINDINERIKEVETFQKKK